jgi:sugar phosphate isomerase/epimerase
MSFEHFLTHIKDLGIDGVSLESCFIPRFDDEYLKGVKRQLDDAKLDRVYAWGHPDGLEGGGNEKAFEDMIRHISYADQIGARVMRVVGSSLMYRFEPHEPQIQKLIWMFSEAVKIAERLNIKLALKITSILIRMKYCR